MSEAVSDESRRDAARAAFVRAQLGDAAPAPVRASADAGFRSYWRTQAADGGSRIVMDSPPELEDVRPWLAMHECLQAGGVRVPKVLARDIEDGWLLLEDLGTDNLLQRIHVDNADHWFAHAFAQLLKLQKIPSPVTLPAYDEALVRRELALFPDWFLARHLGITLNAAQQRAWEEVNRFLVAGFETAPQVLVHRDFIVRNLMPVDAGVAVLDFQDAVRGPLAYDVLSLLRDAFVSWPQARIDGWIDDYLAAAREAGLATPAPADFRRDFTRIGIQRHLKVLGIFARLHHRDGKPRYLADAPRFLAYLDTSLPRFPELAALHTLLRERVYPRIPPMTLPA